MGENPQEYDLLQLGYLFAVESIEPEFGIIEVKRVQIFANGSKEKEEIPMVPCSNLTLSEDDSWMK